MKILFLGDIYGAPGINAVKQMLPKIKMDNKIDFTIINAENATNGKSLSKSDYESLMELKIDALTMGNHTYYGTRLYYINKVKNLLVPANLIGPYSHHGTKVFTCAGIKIRISNIIGNALMFVDSTCPFKKMQEIVSQDKSDIHIVDFHGEASSEKAVFSWAFDGEVSAVLGTHTHIQTADERVLPKGTAFITDAGMCGVLNSSIGVDIEPLVGNYLYDENNRFQQATGDVVISGVVLDIDNDSKKVKSIKRIREYYYG